MNINRSRRPSVRVSSFQRSTLDLLIVAGFLFICRGTACAQGTVTFDYPTIYIGVDGTRSYTDATGMRFQSFGPGGGQSYDRLIRLGNLGTQGIPANGTIYLQWYVAPQRQETVLVTLTNGGAFGFMQVDLADPHSPSSNQLAVTFIGTKSDGSIVATTFTTPGNGARTFQTYYFGSDFQSGLVSVSIPSVCWAMDNLVFDNVVVPEPGTFILFGMGGLGVAVWQWLRRLPKHHLR